MGEKKEKREYPASIWVKRFLVSTAVVLAVVCAATAILDPFFHYHAPLNGFFYTLSDQRCQNDGITKHFSYDAVITGTSMAENFRASEFDGLFRTTSIKVPYPGGTFREIGDNLRTAFRTHDGIRYVLRGLDYSHLTEDPMLLRTDMGEYPSYLYDRNPFNDVEYLCNRSAFLEYILPMLARRMRGVAGGVTDFDSYSYSGASAYGAEIALGDRRSFSPDRNEHSGLTDEERETVRENIRRNVTSIAEENPDTSFLYFFTPYSVIWYGALLEEGRFGKQLEAERIAAEEMFALPNIRVFSFSADASVTTDLSHYKDPGHYSPEISSLILNRIAAGENELTPQDLEDYLTAEDSLYRSFDYDSLIP
ncbi:MAG: hypothetical protein K6G16_07770 [Lachnospiraceae bacterium]|nr:hypothetical protein [Lachnospiraceae bacterium]